MCAHTCKHPGQVVNFWVRNLSFLFTYLLMIKKLFFVVVVAVVTGD